MLGSEILRWVVVLGSDHESPRFNSQLVQYFGFAFLVFFVSACYPRIVFGFLFFFGPVYVCMLPPAVTLQPPSVYRLPTNRHRRAYWTL